MRIGRRVAHVDRRRRSHRRLVHRDQRVGPATSSPGSSSCCSRSSATSHAGRTASSSPARSRGRGRGFYAEAIRGAQPARPPDDARREGEPLRRGAEAEPFLGLAQRTRGRRPRRSRSSTTARTSYRRSSTSTTSAPERLITLTSGCCAPSSARSERRAATTPPFPARARLAGRLRRRAASRLRRRPLRGALRGGGPAPGGRGRRRAVQEVGAGRFEPREIARLEEGVRVDEHLDKVASEL